MSFINGQTGLKSTGPNSIEALGIFVLTILYLVYVGPIITSFFGKNALILVTLGLGLLPLVYSLIAHHDFISIFKIKKTQKKHVLGGLYLCMGMFVFTFFVSSIVGYFIPETQKVDYQFISYVSKENILLVIITVSLLPAICEEILFRGYILSGLRTFASETVSIILCGIMFGLMHLDPYKIPLTILIGIGLSFAATKSGSIYIPIFMHGLHNLILLLITRYYLVFTHDYSVLYNNLRDIIREICKSERLNCSALLLIIAFSVIVIFWVSFILIYVGIGFLEKTKTKTIDYLV